MTIRDPRSGYRTSTRTRRVEGTDHTETLHWDGRQDANVRPKPVSLSLKVHVMSEAKDMHREGATRDEIARHVDERSQ